MLAVQTHNLCKYYGKELGIKDVSLEIEQGEIFGFIGPNGAGKSTTIRTLLGLLIPSSGSASIFGRDIRKVGEVIRKSIGYLPSEVNYYDEMSSQELLEYHCRFYGITDYSEIKHLANTFELNLRKPISELSFGNKKKCGIIQALVHKPKLLIMDEPTSGLDPLMQNVFFDVLKEENKKGTTLFFSSHVLSEIQHICHRTAIIKQGQIIATENIEKLLHNQLKKVTLTFTEKPEKLELPNGIQQPHWKDKRLTFDYFGPVNSLTQWISGLNLQDVVLEEPALEALFMNYYEHNHE